MRVMLSTDLALAGQLIELAHVGTDDEALLLARDENEPAVALSRAACSLSTMAPAPRAGGGQRILTLALAVEHRPGNALWIDREAPIRNALMSVMIPASFCRGALHGPARYARRHVMRLTSAGSKWSTAITRWVSCSTSASSCASRR